MKAAFFDLEIADVLPDPVPGESWDIWSFYPFHISVGATLVPPNRPVIHRTVGLEPWLPGDRSWMLMEEVLEFVDYLGWMVNNGNALFTWNGAAFDWRLLALESGNLEAAARLCLDSYDPAFQALCQFGYPIGIANVAKGFGIPGKVGIESGAMAPKLWQEGQFDTVLRYVEGDVMLLRMVCQKIQETKEVRWFSRAGNFNTRFWPKFYTVRELLQRPCARPLGQSREEVTAWLKAYV